MRGLIAVGEGHAPALRHDGHQREEGFVLLVDGLVGCKPRGRGRKRGLGIRDQRDDGVGNRIAVLIGYCHCKRSGFRLRANSEQERSDYCGIASPHRG